MVAASDTGPVSNLALIGRLDLLPDQFEKIYIPTAVKSELARIPTAGRASIQQALQAGWLEVHPVGNTRLVAVLANDLDQGESEAIALTIELGADLLLIDERLGRQVAGRFGLKFIGILGILLEAKHQGYLPLVKPVLDDLIHTAGFWVSQALYQHVLRTAGE